MEAAAGEKGLRKKPPRGRGKSTLVRNGTRLILGGTFSFAFALGYDDVCCILYVKVAFLLKCEEMF